MIRLLMFAIFVNLSFAASKFEIQDWSTRSSLEPTQQIQLEATASGKLLKALPTSLNSATFYLRFKEDQNLYGFYEGNPKGGFFEKMYAFKLPSGDTKKWVSTKFYRKIREKAFRDEDEIYFDQNFIYSAYVPTLYYKEDSKWMTINAESNKASALLIQTQPSGAELFVESEKLGNSPFKTSGIEAGVIAITVKAAGYLSKVFLIETIAGQEMNVNLELLPLILQNDEVQIKTTQYTIPVEDNVEQHIETLTQVNKELSELMVQLDSLTARFNNLYGTNPEPPPSSIDEWQSLPYLNYKENYIAIRKEAFESQVSIYKDRIAYLTSTRLKLKERITFIENQLDSIKVKPTAFKWTILDSSKGQYGFKFKVQSEDGKHDVVYKATAILTPTQAAELKDDLDRGDSSNVEFTLKFQNKLVRIPHETNVLERYYRYRQYRISKDTNQFAFAGTFVLPPYIASNPEVIAWLNADEIEAEKRLAYEKKQQKILAQKRLELEAAQFQELLKKLRGEVIELANGHFIYKGKKVEMSPFALNTTEITQEHYQLITNKNPSTFKNPKKPVHNVSWDDANNFCKTVGGFLPTQAQWEYAMRSGTNTYFFWGERAKDATPYAIFEENSLSEGVHSPAYGPQEVGTKRANPWGFFDGAGNVREWVKDWDGLVSFELYIEDKNPQGISNWHTWHYEHIIKGGSWKQDKKMLEHAKSDYEDTRFWADDLGFRCAYPSNQTRTKEEINAIINKHKKVVKKENASDQGVVNTDSTKNQDEVLVIPVDSNAVKQDSSVAPLSDSTAAAMSKAAADTNTSAPAAIQPLEQLPINSQDTSANGPKALPAVTAESQAPNVAQPVTPVPKPQGSENLQATESPKAIDEVSNSPKAVENTPTSESSSEANPSAEPSVETVVQEPKI